MSVIHLNSENYESQVLQSDKKVLIDFYADWCGSCRVISPFIDEIAEEFSEYKVCKINVDEQPELASKFQVMSIPALFVVENGEVINKSIGAIPKSQILDLLN